MISDTDALERYMRGNSTFMEKHDLSRLKVWLKNLEKVGRSNIYEEAAAFDAFIAQIEPRLKTQPFLGTVVLMAPEGSEETFFERQETLKSVLSHDAEVASPEVISLHLNQLFVY